MKAKELVRAGGDSSSLSYFGGTDSGRQQGSPEQGLEPSIQHRIERLVTGSLPEALALIETAFSLEPAREGAWFYYRGWCFSLMGMLDDALSDYSKAIKADPKFAPAFFNRASLHYALGRTTEAHSDISRFLDLYAVPECGDVRVLSLSYGLLGKVLSSLRQSRDAVKAFSSAVEVDPANPEWLFQRGAVLRESKQTEPELALMDYAMAISLRPTDGRFYIARAAVLLDMKRPDSALPSYAEALERIDDDRARAVVLTNRAECYASMRKHEDAISDLGESLRLGSAKGRLMKRYIFRADSLLVLSRFDEAIRDCDSALSIDGCSAEALTLRAEANHGKRRFRRAIEDVTKASSLVLRYSQKKPTTVVAAAGETNASVRLDSVRYAARFGLQSRRLHPGLRKLLVANEQANRVRFASQQTQRLPSVYDGICEMMRLMEKGDHTGATALVVQAMKSGHPWSFRPVLERLGASLSVGPGFLPACREVTLGMFTMLNSSAVPSDLLVPFSAAIRLMIDELVQAYVELDRPLEALQLSEHSKNTSMLKSRSGILGKIVVVPNVKAFLGHGRPCPGTTLAYHLIEDGMRGRNCVVRWLIQSSQLKRWDIRELDGLPNEATLQSLLDTLPNNSRALRAARGHFKKVLQVAGSFVGATLYDLLFEGIVEDLPEGSKLGIVPDRQLFQVPFGCLFSRKAEPGRRFMDRHPLAVTLCLRMVAVPRVELKDPRHSVKLVACGGVEYEKASLASSRKELRELAILFGSSLRKRSSDGTPSLEHVSVRQTCDYAGCNEKATVRCSDCYSAVYCSPAHQLEDWTSHRTLCVQTVKATSKFLAENPIQLTGDADRDARQIMDKMQMPFIWDLMRFRAFGAYSIHMGSSLEPIEQTLREIDPHRPVVAVSQATFKFLDLRQRALARFLLRRHARGNRGADEDDLWAKRNDGVFKQQDLWTAKEEEKHRSRRKDVVGVICLSGPSFSPGVFFPLLRSVSPRFLHFGVHSQGNTVLSDDQSEFPEFQLTGSLGGAGKTKLHSKHLATEVDLRGTELVFLNCCNSGAGRVVDDGVLGLYRACFQAGARNVICALWRVTDRISKNVSRHFYRTHLLGGYEFAESLQKALQEVRKFRFKSGLQCEDLPSLWGAFQLFGGREGRDSEACDYRTVSGRKACK